MPVIHAYNNAENTLLCAAKNEDIARWMAYTPDFPETILVLFAKARITTDDDVCEACAAILQKLEIEA